jgi:glycosyltransferase involved in cell wall biosynthesis
MEPLVSILIPAFNAQPWIADAIQSALAQSWQKTEIIVIDDGSTDDTLAVAKRFCARGATVLTQRNQGAAVTRNNLLALSRGEYIQWLDADDVIAPDKIKLQLAAAELGRSQRTLYSSGWRHFFYRLSAATFSPSPLWCDLSPTEWLTRKMEFNCHMQTATWLVSRELTDAAGPWDSRLVVDDDGEYFCRVQLQSDAIRFVPGAWTYYRMTQQSSRVSYIGRSPAKLEAQFLSMKLHIRYLRSLADSSRTRAACVKYLQKHMADFYLTRPDIVEQMHCIARELGGELQPPSVRSKYRYIQRAFGWRIAKHVQTALPNFKCCLLRTSDRILASLLR